MLRSPPCLNHHSSPWRIDARFRNFVIETTLEILGNDGMFRFVAFIQEGQAKRQRHIAEDAAVFSPGNNRARRHQRSEEHTSELQSLMRISYAVFCLKKKKLNTTHTN